MRALLLDGKNSRKAVYIAILWRHSITVVIHHSPAPVTIHYLKYSVHLRCSGAIEKATAVVVESEARSLGEETVPEVTTDLLVLAEVHRPHTQIPRRQRDKFE